MTKINSLLSDLSHLAYLSKDRPINETFTRIYKKKHWGGVESISGTGSDLVQTATIREKIPQILAELRARSLLDIPCGDFNWMRHVGLGIEYIGGDIVPELIHSNISNYGCKGRNFAVMDITRDEIPESDVILCRDCLVHFSYRDIRRTIANIKRSRSGYLLTTTFTDAKNRDIRTGSWRALNLARPPLNFPEPMSMINENCSEINGRFADKCLGLWKISELPS